MNFRIKTYKILFEYNEKELIMGMILNEN